MKANNKTQRFFCRDALGKDLFYLDLIHIDGSDLILIETSLYYDISALPQGQHYINMICEEQLNPERRLGLIALLFIFLKALPGIEEYYFKDYTLDKDGRFVDCTYRTIQELILQEQFPEFTLFSPRDNYIYFYAIVNLLKKEIKVNSVNISRQQFEYLIADYLPLQLEFLENIKCDSQFFIVKQGSLLVTYVFYIMSNKFSIKMFFFVICR